jgi:hypothetical protein
METNSSGAPRSTVERMLEHFHATTGRPLVVSQPVYAAMKAQGIDTTHVKRNDPLRER